MKMFVDPVVEEMRRNFEKVAEECGFDLDRIVERLRREEAQHADQLVDRSKPLRTTTEALAEKPSRSSG